MWARRTMTESVAVIERNVAVTRPVPKTGPVTTTENELRAYIRTADAIGFKPSALVEARMLQFLAERSIPIYDYDEVMTYLARKSGGVNVVWRPLREIDHSPGWRWTGPGNTYYAYDPKEWECRSYDAAVPLRVLGTVEMIVKEFGNDVKFFVSDYAAARPDPFIMLTERGMSRMVFDVWDEPGFTG